MKTAISTAISFLTGAVRDIVAPPFCVSCGSFLTERAHLCERCMRAVIPPTTCTLEITRSYHMTVYALSGYEGIVRTLILSKNYGNPLKMRQLGELMARTDFCPWHQFDYIVPVPLHWTRYAWRGFNQAAILARAISVAHGLPVLSAVYRRAKTVQQTTLTHTARQQNVHRIFALSPSAQDLFRGKRILLIDDVMTTGATMGALARAIVDARPASISAVVAARAL